MISSSFENPLICPQTHTGACIFGCRSRKTPAEVGQIPRGLRTGGFSCPPESPPPTSQPANHPTCQSTSLPSGKYRSEVARIRSCTGDRPAPRSRPLFFESTELYATSAQESRKLVDIHRIHPALMVDGGDMTSVSTRPRRLDDQEKKTASIRSEAVLDRWPDSDPFSTFRYFCGD